jgi:hypothetical protein
MFLLQSFSFTPPEEKGQDNINFFAKLIKRDLFRNRAKVKLNTWFLMKSLLGIGQCKNHKIK